ncbi:MAG: M20/M25/M40 family metallo-hydrolase [Myxococcota bacterium]
MTASSQSIEQPNATQLERAVSHLIRLVDAQSLSGEEAPAVAEAERIAAELGLQSERMPVAEGRENLLVGDPSPRVILCTHLDTVPPFIPARRDATHVHGRGSADAKGVAIAMVYALAALKAIDQDSGIACLLVVGEETDHAGAKAAAKSRLRPTHIVLGEPCGLVPARAQKGLLKLTLSASGTAGHSAYPELGASAIHRMLEGLQALRAAPLPSDDELGETTLNVGQISGGMAANVIARDASALILIRCAAPVDAILNEVHSRLPEGVTAVEIGRAEPVGFSCAGQPGGPTVPFNTDAHTLAPLGAEMLLMGPGDMRCAHAAAERLSFTDLSDGIRAYAQLASRLARTAAVSPS